MHTVQNKKIRVTISDEIRNLYAQKASQTSTKQVLPSGDKVNHDIEAIERGLILSEAMKKLANKAKIAALRNEAPTRPQIVKAAKNILADDYCRMNFGHSIFETPQGGGLRGEREAEKNKLEAETFAAGCLFPVDQDQAENGFRDEILARIEAGTEPTTREINFMKKLSDLKTGAASDEKAASALLQAEKSLTGSHNRRIENCETLADMDGWQIEIIGEMPAQIGTSRYH